MSQTSTAAPQIMWMTTPVPRHEGKDLRRPLCPSKHQRPTCSVCAPPIVLPASTIVNTNANVNIDVYINATSADFSLGAAADASAQFARAISLTLCSDRFYLPLIIQFYIHICRAYYLTSRLDIDHANTGSSLIHCRDTVFDQPRLTRVVCITCAWYYLRYVPISCSFLSLTFPFIFSVLFFTAPLFDIVVWRWLWESYTIDLRSRIDNRLVFTDIYVPNRWVPPQFVLCYPL